MKRQILTVLVIGSLVLTGCFLSKEPPPVKEAVHEAREDVAIALGYATIRRAVEEIENKF